ncbi:hypothetical protein B484DRAFT_468779, partial [Ochromonadaceae sp. CCMP2298]
MYQDIDAAAPSPLDDAASTTLARKDNFLLFYTTFSGLTTAVLVLVTLISIVFIIVDTSVRDVHACAEFLLRLYGLSLMLLAILCELEWFEVVRQSSILQNWTSRGVFQTFLGLFSFVEYGEVQLPGVRVKGVVGGAAVALMLCGTTYTCLGCMNLKGILLGRASPDERGYWDTLMLGLKLPRRTAVISLIGLLLAEAPPAHVEEAAPTEEAGSPPCWANIENRHAPVQGQQGQQGLKRSSDAAGLNRSPSANSQGYLAPVDPTSARSSLPQSQLLGSPSSSSISSSGPSSGGLTGAAASALPAPPPVSGPLAVVGVPALASNYVDAASPAQIRPMPPFSPALLCPYPNSSTGAAQSAAAESQTTPDASQGLAELPEQ